MIYDLYNRKNTFIQIFVLCYIVDNILITPCLNCQSVIDSKQNYYLVWHLFRVLNSVEFLCQWWFNSNNSIKDQIIYDLVIFFLHILQRSFCLENGMAEYWQKVNQNGRNVTIRGIWFLLWLSFKWTYDVTSAKVVIIP